MMSDCLAIGIVALSAIGGVRISVAFPQDVGDCVGEAVGCDSVWVRVFAGDRAAVYAECNVRLVSSRVRSDCFWCFPLDDMIRGCGSDDGFESVDHFSNGCVGGIEEEIEATCVAGHGKSDHGFFDGWCLVF